MRGTSPNRHTVTSLSPLELLLPEGFARAALVLGGACPGVLSPSAEAAPGDGPVDLVVVAPTTAERRNPAWVSRAAGAAASRLSPDGIVYVVPARARSLRRALTALGLRHAETMLHIPDVARSRHLVPIGTVAGRYALSGRLDMKALKRFAASAAVRSSRLSELGPTGIVLRRVPAAPLAGWLFELDAPSARPDSVMLTSRRAWSGGTVLHRFVEGDPDPDAVAKVSPQAPDERHGLLDVAPGAARAGVRVPEILWCGRLGPADALVQSALTGTGAKRLLELGRLDPGDLYARLGGWLERWSRDAGRTRLLGRADVDRFVLSPARRLAGANRAYLDYLEALCARAVGSNCSFVPTHGDLTATNVLVDRDHGLGILDWEEAAEDGLPLTDFLYAATDTVAAAAGYRDRVQAFRSCFASGGVHTALVEELRSRLARALEIDDTVQEICFHACWLHHASNEHARSAGSLSGPFMTIVQVIADDPDRVGIPRLRP
jgi:phosphotransferase family enzyme